jgi:hypothetical protein
MTTSLISKPVPVVSSARSDLDLLPSFSTESAKSGHRALHPYQRKTPGYCPGLYFLETKANLSTCDGCNLELSDSASRGIPEPQAVNFDPARPVAVCIPTAMPTVAIFAVPIMAIVCFANNVFSVCGFIDVDGLIAMNVFVHGGVLIALNAFIYGSVLIAMNVFVHGSVLIAMNVILCRVSKSRRRH